MRLEFSRASRRSLFAALPVALVLAYAAPAAADYRFRKGHFAKSTAVGTQVIVGVGFRPRALVFHWTRQSTLDTFETQVQVGYGFATSPDRERAVSAASEHGAFPGDTGKSQSQTRSIVLLSSGAPALGAQAELTSLDADGFTITWAVNEPRADLIHYVALGGTDLTDATVAEFALLPGTGVQPVTGLGFRPDFLMLLGIHSVPLDGLLDEAQLTLGFASGPGFTATVTMQMEDSGLLQRNSCGQQRTDRIYLDLNDSNGSGGCGTESTRLRLVSFDADGFTLDREVSLAPGNRVHYLALKGGAYRVRGFNKSVVSGASIDDTVTGLGLRPVGLMLASANQFSGTATFPGARISFGAGDGTNMGSTWHHDTDTTTANSHQRTSTTSVALIASSTVLEALATVKSFVDDTFTLTWSPNSTSPNEIVAVAFGADADAGLIDGGSGGGGAGGAGGGGGAGGAGGAGGGGGGGGAGGGAGALLEPDAGPGPHLAVSCGCSTSPGPCVLAMVLLVSAGSRTSTQTPRAPRGR